MGLGSLGGGAQMLFGGSGGQDLFQKITWVLGSIFMGLSLILALMKSSYMGESRYLDQAARTMQQQMEQRAAAQKNQSQATEPVQQATE